MTDGTDAAEVDEDALFGVADAVTDPVALRRDLEAVLLVVDEPADPVLLATALEQPVDAVRGALRELAADYTASGRGFDLREVAGGWRLYTRPQSAEAVERFLRDGQAAKLTQAALETLAVVAYRQPVTRAQIAAIRGVSVDGVLRTLVGRGLVAESRPGGDAEGPALLYRTTPLFLERLGLVAIDDLPPIAPLLPEVDAVDELLEPDRGRAATGDLSDMLPQSFDGD